MTYTEIREFEEENGYIPDTDEPTSKTEAALEVLKLRNGFSWWWDELSSGDRDEIFEEIKTALI